MNTITVILFILWFVLIICSIYISEKLMKSNKTENTTLRRFVMNIRYPRYDNDSIDLENTRDCNVHSLEKCSIIDPTTLFGCRELLVRCTHFSDDTKYYENGNETYVFIPKNNTPDEGYALAITNLDQACHPLHGDLVLVTRDVDSSEYMFVCKCKMDGYIGNDTITGNCTTVRICNGKIDSIDKPLNRIDCVCADYEENYRYNDSLPICKSMTVDTANEKYTDWHYLVPWISDNLLSKNYFNRTVALNVNSSKLLDPCKHALHDTSLEIQNGRYDTLYNTCVFEDSGIPVRTGILGKVDGAKFDTVDGALFSENYRQIRVLDGVMGKRQYAAITANVKLGEFLPLREYTIAMPENTKIGNPGHVQMSVKKSLIGPVCDTVLTSYSCFMEQNYDRTVRGIPTPGVKEPPAIFIWGTDDWNDAYDMFIYGIRNVGSGLELDNERLDKHKETLNYYGMRLVSDLHPDETKDNSVVRLLDDDNYRKHSELIRV